MCILLNLTRHIIVLLVIELQWRQFLLQRLEDDEQSRYHEYLEQCTNQHTTNGGGTQCLVTVLTYT